MANCEAIKPQTQKKYTVNRKRMLESMKLVNKNCNDIDPGMKFDRKKKTFTIKYIFYVKSGSGKRIFMKNSFIIFINYFRILKFEAIFN